MFEPFSEDFLLGNAQDTYKVCCGIRAVLPGFPPSLFLKAISPSAKKEWHLRMIYNPWVYCYSKYNNEVSRQWFILLR